MTHAKGLRLSTFKSRPPTRVHKNLWPLMGVLMVSISKVLSKEKKVKTIYLYAGETGDRNTPIEDYDACISFETDDCLLGENRDGHCALIEVSDEVFWLLDFLCRLEFDENGPLIDRIYELATEVFRAGIKFAQMRTRKSIGL